MVHRRQFLRIYSLKFCDIWQNFYFYRILNDKNFIMEVEQTNFVIQLIITVQYYIIDYLKTRLLKFSQISFKCYWLIIIVSCVHFIGKSTGNEQISCKLSKSEILRLYSIIHVAM